MTVAHFILAYAALSGLLVAFFLAMGSTRT